MQQPILKHLIVLAGCLLLTATAAAQRYVSGKVVGPGNEPLAGAAVVVKENKTIGMTTDAEGNYRLRIPDNKEYTLQASFIGYVTQSHPLQTGQDRMDFAMELLAVEKVAATPGVCFGDDSCIRLSYALSMEEMTDGLERIKAFCLALK